MEKLFEKTVAASLKQKCLLLLERFPQTADDLTLKLETFLINNSGDVLTLESMGRFEQYVAVESSKVSALGKRGSHNMSSPAMPPKNVKPAMITELRPITETKALETSFSHVAGIPYAQRTNAGQIIQSLNPSLLSRPKFSPSTCKPIGMRCKVQLCGEDFDNIDHRYRFMFTTLDERAKSMEKHLLQVQRDISTALGIDESTAIQSVSNASPDVGWYSGRICCDSEGKMNATSLLLEGSYRDSKGRRVKLDVSEIAGYSLFPGQIVMVEGINASGTKIVAKRIFDGFSKPNSSISSNKLLEYHYSTAFQNGDALEVVVACGPFTTSDNLLYDPLIDLLRRVITKKPDLLVLVGPFVDISQPLLADGHVCLTDGETVHEATYEMVFVEKIVRDCLGALFNSEEDIGVITTNIVIVPSLLDGHHEYVFPQPPFGDRDRFQTSYFDDPLGVLDIPFSKSTDPAQRVHLLPNPTMFRVNDVLFAACSNDVLFQLSQEEISFNIEGHRLGRLAGHILKQQSFSPQFPPNGLGHAQLDFRHSKHWTFKHRPDVLILPSKLSYMARDVDGTVVVNPGTLARGISGGTFAELSILPIDKSKLEKNEEVMNTITTRCKVDLIRI